jgi:hypothetical protein
VDAAGSLAVVCLRTFKFCAAGADERFVNDSVDPASPRVVRDPVNDSGETPASTTGPAPLEGIAGRRITDPAGFRFNLDDALARLSEPHQPIPRFNWSAVTPSTMEQATTNPATMNPATTNPATTNPARPGPTSTQGPMHAPSMTSGSTASGSHASVPTSAPSRPMFPDQGSRVRPLTQPTLDPLPEIVEATRFGETPAVAHRSTSPAHVPARVAAPPPAPATMVVSGSEAFAAGAIGFSPDSTYAPRPFGPTDRRAGDGLPRLPDADLTAPPPMATMMSTPAVAPIVRLTSARTGRKQKKGRRLGKLLLVLFVLAGLVGAALMFGRDYLFPEDWAKDVAPAVDALQLSSGLEFADPVVVNTLPEADYAAKVAGVMFGPAFGAEWTTSVPRWRALGLVDGEPTVESVNAAVSDWKPAFYDPADGQIYRSGTASGPALEAAVRDSLAAALVDQLSADSPAPGVDATAEASLAHLALADLGAELVAGRATAVPDRSALQPVPVPMAHRLIGAEDLGGPILESLGVVPSRAGAISGFDVDIAGLLDVPRAAAPVPAMLEGDTQDGEATARGSDFWYTVLAAYLPTDTAAVAADSIGADLYVPAARGAQQCVYGTFTSTTPEALGVLQVAAVAWAALAPVQAGAQATTLADGVTVQLSTCDPGAGAAPTRMPDVAPALVTRQIARLGLD